MDNFHIDIISRGQDNLKLAMNIAFSHDGPATHYSIRPAADGKPLRIIFFWGDARDSNGFGFKLDADGCTEFALRWLDAAEYGNEPDQDGENAKGWRVYNEAWGHVDGDHKAIIAVTPAWAMFGK